MNLSEKEITEPIINKIGKNINREYRFTFLMNFSLTRGLWMIYLASKGMSLFQLGILESIFHLTSFMMEIPTGVVADLYGRKVSRVIGRIFSVLDFILVLTGQGFWAYALAFVIAALSYNFESGAGEALIYDSLKTLDDTKRFMKVTGKKELVYQLTSTAAFILGGFIATISYTWVYLISILFALVSVWESLFFTEPVVFEKCSSSILHSMKRQIRESIGQIRQKPRIAYLYLSVNTLITFITTLFFYLQNYYKNQGVSESSIGIMLAAASVFGAFAGLYAHKAEARWGERVLLRVLPVLVSGGLWLVALTRFEGLAFIYLSALDGILFVVTRDYINRLIPSEQRATLLSVDSMMFSMNMIVLFPIVGIIGDALSLKTAFLMMAVYSTLIVAGNLFMLGRLERMEAAQD